MAQLNARLTAPPYRLVAQHAPTEAGIIAHQAEHCPVLAATPLLDTLRLAKAVVPGLEGPALTASGAAATWAACAGPRDPARQDPRGPGREGARHRTVDCRDLRPEAGPGRASLRDSRTPSPRTAAGC